MNMKIPSLILTFFLLVSPALAGDEQLINQMLEQGGEVHLESRDYNIEGPINIPHKNTVLSGEPGTRVIVSSEISTPWFSPTVGVVNILDPYNVTIKNFEIDGNCHNLPREWANSGPQFDHDQEQLIKIIGNSDNFGTNIKISNMVLLNSFGDGIQARFIDGIICNDNFISNCQHDGIFFTSIVNGEIFNNKIAGLTSDCVRCDNCINNRVYKNVLFSYRGDNSNGAYQGGQNGVQVANAGSSHGYDASNKPTTTANVEVFDNVFANDMLNAVWVHSVDQNQVYLHDNRYIQGDELETMGVPVEVDTNGDSNVSFVNPPTKEMSEKIFSSIFDVLNLTFSDSGKTNQTDSQINYSVIKTPKGRISGGIKIIGFKDMVVINGTQYIPDTNSTLVKYAAVKSPDFNFTMNNTKITKTVDVKIENGTAYAKLDVKMEWTTTKKNKKTGAITKTKHSTTATFNDSCPSPNVLERPKELKGIVYQYPTFFRVNVPVPAEGIVNMQFNYDGNSSQHNYLAGTRNYTSTGVEYTEYANFNRWDGTIPHENNVIYVLGEFDRSKLNVTATTPYEIIAVTDFEIIKKGYPEKIISDMFYVNIVFFSWAFAFLWWLKRRIF